MPSRVSLNATSPFIGVPGSPQSTKKQLDILIPKNQAFQILYYAYIIFSYNVINTVLNSTKHKHTVTESYMVPRWRANKSQNK